MTQDNLDKLDLLLFYPISVAEEDRDIDLFDGIDTSEVHFDKRYFRRRNIIILRQKYVLFTWHEAKKILSRVAVFLFAIFLAAFVAVLSVSALRHAVWNAILEWYDEYISIHFESAEPKDPVSEEPVTPSGANVPDHIEMIYKPTLIEEGVEEVILQADQGMVLIDYYVGDDWVATYEQHTMDVQIMTDNNQATVSTVWVLEYEAQLFQYDDRRDVYLVWTDGEYTFSLCGTNLENLLKMANSIKAQENVSS